MQTVWQVGNREFGEKAEFSQAPPSFNVVSATFFVVGSLSTYERLPFGNYTSTGSMGAFSSS